MTTNIIQYVGQGDMKKQQNFRWHLIPYVYAHTGPFQLFLWWQLYTWAATPPSGDLFPKEESQAKRLCLGYFSGFMVVSLQIYCTSSKELGFYTEGFQLCLLLFNEGFSLQL